MKSADAENADLRSGKVASSKLITWRKGGFVRTRTNPPRSATGHSSTRRGTTHGARDAHYHSPTSHAVIISAREEDFRAHGHTLARETHHLTITAMPDTGCQSCLAGPSLMSSLHLSENELIPVSLVMHSASGTNLPILGAALLRIRVQLTGIETRQMVYFSSMATKLYLSLATCIDLGLIPKEFPFSTPMQAPGATPGSHQAIPPSQHTAALQTKPPLLGPPTRTPTSPTGNDQARGPTQTPTPTTQNHVPSSTG